MGLSTENYTPVVIPSDAKEGDILYITFDIFNNDNGRHFGETKCLLFRESQYGVYGELTGILFGETSSEYLAFWTNIGLYGSETKISIGINEIAGFNMDYAEALIYFQKNKLK